jgi:hypothetical protein
MALNSRDSLPIVSTARRGREHCRNLGPDSVARHHLPFCNAGPQRSSRSRAKHRIRLENVEQNVRIDGHDHSCSAHHLRILTDDVDLPSSSGVLNSRQ